MINLCDCTLPFDIGLIFSWGASIWGIPPTLPFIEIFVLAEKSPQNAPFK